MAHPGMGPRHGTFLFYKHSHTLELTVSFYEIFMDAAVCKPRRGYFGFSCGCENHYLKVSVLYRFYSETETSISNITDLELYVAVSRS